MCTKCKEMLPTTRFRRDKYSKTGYTCRCKECIDRKYKNTSFIMDIFNV